MGGGITSGVRGGFQFPTLSAQLVDGALFLSVVVVGALWSLVAWNQDPSLLRVLAVVVASVAILVTGRGRRHNPLPEVVALLVGSLVPEVVS